MKVTTILKARTSRLKLGEMRKEMQQVKESARDTIQSFDAGLQSIASKINLIVEQYPQLRAVESVNIGMQSNIALENEIAASRIQYNDNVELYSNAVEMFPSNLIAPLFGFTSGRYKYIEADSSKKEPVTPLYSEKIKEKYE